MKNTISHIRLFVSIIILGTLLSSCSQDKEKILPTVNVVPVSSASVISNERISTTAQGENIAPVSFKASGRIVEVAGNVGKTVKKGELLAKISPEEAAVALEGYQNILGVLSQNDSSSILAALETMKKSTSDLYLSRIQSANTDKDSAIIRERIAASELALAEKNYENTKKVLSGSLMTAADREAQAEAGVQFAKNQLENTKKLLASQEETLYKNGLAALSNTFILARGSREFVDMFLGISVENSSKNDAFENTLDTFAKNKAETEYMKFEKIYTETHDWYFGTIANKQDVDKETVKEGLNRSITVLESLRTLLYSVQDILEKTPPSTQFNAATIASYKTKVAEMLASLESAIISSSGGGIKGVLEQMIAFDKESALKIQSLEDALLLAEKNKVLATSGKLVSESSNTKDADLLFAEIHIKKEALEAVNNAVKQAANTIAVLQSEKQAKLSELDAKISELRVQIAQASMQSKLSKTQLDNHVLVAPFDGVILEQNAQVGELVQSGSPIFTISSPTAVKAIVNVSRIEDFLSQLNNGNDTNEEKSDGPFNVQFEGVSGKVFTGSISSIPQSKNPVTGKYSFEIRFSSKYSLIAGEKIWIKTAKKSEREMQKVNTPDTVTIPVAAILGKYGTPTVYVLQGNTVRLRNIRVIQKNQEIARVEGLTSTDYVVVDGKENILDGAEVVANYRN